MMLTYCFHFLEELIQNLFMEILRTPDPPFVPVACLTYWQVPTRIIMHQLSVRTCVTIT